MATINEVYLIGNLARDMELRESKSGKSMAVGCIAVDSGDLPAFISIVAYNKTAEFMSKLKKGQRVFISGSITTYQDASKKTQTNVLVRSCEFTQHLNAKDSIEPKEVKMSEEELPF